MNTRKTSHLGILGLVVGGIALSGCGKETNIKIVGKNWERETPIEKVHRITSSDWTKVLDTSGKKDDPSVEYEFIREDFEPTGNKWSDRSDIKYCKKGVKKDHLGNINIDEFSIALKSESTIELCSKTVYAENEWRFDRKENTSGDQSITPHGFEGELGEDQRVSLSHQPQESYTITITDQNNSVYTERISKEIWELLKKGDSCKAKVSSILGLNIDYKSCDS